MNVVHRRKKIVNFKLIYRFKDKANIKLSTSPLYNNDIIMIKGIDFSTLSYDYNPSEVVIKKYINYE